LPVGSASTNNAALITSPKKIQTQPRLCAFDFVDHTGVGINAGRFPKGFKLGPRITAWKVEDIRKLIESRN
jgi:hypothetical protein